MRAAGLTALALVFGAACYRKGDPQLIVQIDTDVFVPSQTSGRDDASEEAAFDRLRVEVLWPASGLRDNRDFQVGSAAVWPVEIGVPKGPSEDPTVELTLTLYKQADIGRALDAAPVSPDVAVVRLVRLTVPDAREHARVVLHGECLGVSPDRARGTTCVDDPKALAPVTAGVAIAEDIDDPSRLGSWPRVATKPCVSAGGVDARRCVPGGLTPLGDAAFSSVVDPGRVDVRAPRVAILRPFFLDRTEVTVLRLRQLLRGTSAKAPPTAQERAGCNYSATAGKTDDEAARCVPFETARAACRSAGGDLPTAAQWEHAARGRGERRRYPWGETAPRCCTAALAFERGCSSLESRSVGSHQPGTRCDTGDVSRDGLLDLGGSVREWVLDRPVAWSDPCYGPPGILVDPSCVDPQGVGSARGGSFMTSFDDAAAALRWAVEDTADVGFRCAYGDAP
jgi:formylglycine-generating enzyme required for sulfatase activity